ncbi:hypothetical protein LTR37_018813 [Vermiconidia calcicola]|uniref:Uncharacterized protein n=1 Tax=Vermiconidia calcicola TaxID=1690605 RepID=A0ACC3MFT5_9PEZI|nr:hypothetical protein LTR37_018813 [Vermiconidia calcicola]
MAPDHHQSGRQEPDDDVNTDGDFNTDDDVNSDGDINLNEWLNPEVLGDLAQPHGTSPPVPMEPPEISELSALSTQNNTTGTEAPLCPWRQHDVLASDFGVGLGNSAVDESCYGRLDQCDAKTWAGDTTHVT